MGKIKSARELAMERTGDLEMIKDLAKGSAGADREPYLKASSLLAGSFLDNESSLEKVAATVGRYPEGAREAAVRIFLQEITNAMDPDNIEKVAAAYRHYRSGREDNLIEELGKTAQDFEDQVRELREELEKGTYLEQHLEHLHSEGISGSALAGANLERSPWWKEQLARFNASSAPEINRLKKQLLASLNNN